MALTPETSQSQSSTRRDIAEDYLASLLSAWLMGEAAPLVDLVGIRHFPDADLGRLWVAAARGIKLGEPCRPGELAEVAQVLPSLVTELVGRLAEPTAGPHHAARLRKETTRAGLIDIGERARHGADLPALETEAARILGSAEAPAEAPELDDVALHGVVGIAARTIAPVTEASVATIAASILALVGALLRGVHTRVGATVHSTAEYWLVAGRSARARKGTASSWASWLLGDLLAEVDQVRGLGSGEAMVRALADVPPDRGVLIIEPEFARPLRAARREGSTLGQVLRDAWDGSPLQARRRDDTLTADAPHAAMLAHVTAGELERELDGASIAGGLINRFLLVHAERAQVLALGRDLDARELDILAGCREHIRQAWQTAQDGGVYRFDAAAADHWERSIYPRLSVDRPGILGDVTARSEAHALRLALTFAVLDGAEDIRVEHVEAAAAWVDYSVATAYHLFAGRDPRPRKPRDRDRELVAMLSDGPVERRSLMRGIYRSLTSDDLDQVRDRLREQGVISLYYRPHPRGGKAAEVWSLATIETAPGEVPS